MRLPLPALAACLAGMGGGCMTDSGSGSLLRKPVVLVVSRIRSVPLDGGADTSVTLLRYDSLGFLIREIRATTFREWDSLGRYTGVRYKDSAVYLEHVVWIGADSAVRTQGTIVVRDRFFKRRPNCW